MKTTHSTVHCVHCSFARISKGISCTKLNKGEQSEQQRWAKLQVSSFGVVNLGVWTGLDIASFGQINVTRFDILCQFNGKMKCVNQNDQNKPGGGVNNWPK